ncbi:hypothetical protein SEUCBS140593_000029 [Sporothrix eucalyptigena]|uniref:Amino acid transporter transmembrane domain-containing protein n=1 Tax=Sporothrix eucalyptigena TaxID=1812306 RepID=A0ABP0AMP7_9PEZI
MTKTPPDSPAVSAQERQAARTLAEHLPQGYTADFVPQDQQPAEGADADETLDRPDTGGRNNSRTSRGSDSRSRTRPSPGLAASASPRISIRGESENDTGDDQPEEISSLQLQGGDVHRSLFRMAEAPARVQLLQSQPPQLLTPSPLSLSTTAAQDECESQQPENQPTQQPTSADPPRKKPHHRRAATFHDHYTPSDVGSTFGGDGSEHGSEYGSADDYNGRPHMQVRDLLAPQGFRRDFVQQQMRHRQLEERAATMQRRRTHLRERRAAEFGAVRMPIARNFVEFLELYGHFADEDLEESDDDEEEEEGLEQEGSEEEDGGDEGGEGVGADLERGTRGVFRRRPSERQPLLGRRASGAVAVAGSDVAGDGTGKAKAGMSQAFFTLLKAFVGTGIMFLPKAYNNGGMVFSTVTLLIVSLLSMAGFELLLRCRQRYGGGYGDIGLAIAGPHMRSLILGSIALSQLGFVCAGIVFAAENLASFASAVAHSHTRHTPGIDDGVDESVLSTNAIIVLEVAILVPLGFVRDIARLGPAALLGDVFIAIGLAYMYAYDISAIASRDSHMHETVQFWFNPSGYALTIGAAIFTFEGIGLILPIQSSMAHPERFRWLLAVVMSIITIAYISVGGLGYAAFGTDTKTEVIDNYPRNSPLVQAVQCLYAVAVLAGMPVQLFPAVRIIEGWLFRHRASSSANGAAVYYHYSGKRDPRIKWAKNALRTALVVACGAIAVLGAGHLDQFVALIGSMACVPLLFIYPPFLHYLGLSDESSVFVRSLDIGLIIVGTVAMIYTTIVTIKGGL